MINDFYDSETEFVKIGNDLGRVALEKNNSTLVNDKRKNNLTNLGYITINNWRLSDKDGLFYATSFLDKSKIENAEFCKVYYKGGILVRFAV
ncbi:MAG TPA: hypothetical protein PK191_09365 [Niabella sp.]|nr:hypothetical protein [Niabella sp.]HOZ97119.1 hypothetical protein [Niabella sp.]HQW15319.1 hypothetical protein [Niabella sp.]HQX20431.1 hypothetical protein [Niabella sp.]HQX42474.1 hypothetical protein [Niabella sp.]